MSLRDCARAAFILCVVASPPALSAQQLHLDDITNDITTDPAQAAIVVADIENFVRAQKLLADATDTATVLQAESQHLDVFVELGRS